MTSEETEQGKKLATEHWEWLEGVLDLQRQMEKKLFMDAAIHFFKHGIEYKTEEVQPK